MLKRITVGLIFSLTSVASIADITFVNRTGMAATDFHFSVDVVRLAGRNLPTSIPWGDPWQVTENGAGLDVTYSWEQVKDSAPPGQAVIVPDGSTFTLVGVSAADVFGANAI